MWLTLPGTIITYVADYQSTLSEENIVLRPAFLRGDLSAGVIFVHAFWSWFVWLFMSCQIDRRLEI